MFRDRVLESKYNNIINIINESGRRFEEDDEFKSHIAKYLCIMCSGFVEKALENTLYNYYRNKTDNDDLKKYISENLRRVNNPKKERIVSTVKSFSTEFSEMIHNYIDNERKMALETLMINRNKIAHGESSDITISQIESNFNKIVEIFKYIETEVLIVEA